MTMTMQRQDLDDYIEYLNLKYPKCFSVDSRLRRPLKKNIIADLQKDGAEEAVTAAVNFYTQNWTYQRALQAGAERIDLNGNKAGVVTELEHRTAVKKVQTEMQEVKVASRSLDEKESIAEAPSARSCSCDAR